MMFQIFPFIVFWMQVATYSVPSMDQKYRYEGGFPVLSELMLIPQGTCNNLGDLR